ncbi:hypothetical protein [Streptomyces sp. NBC_00239]|uniref:hypothetical protein n=1 Tax=Streptomyces sp. NBC_00239 TaxID=2903640 RepID=UPI002E2CD44B|nr:hypothetical protein [Streptomyces sp. NBC_00239]
MHAHRGGKAVAAVGAALAAVIALALAGCAPGDAFGAGGGDGGAGYAQAYADHEPLAVVGYPSAGSLRITQELLWHLADENTDGLQALAADDDADADDADADAAKTAANWIRTFGGKAARGKVTADFYDEGSERQVVVVYFHDTARTKEFEVRLAGADGWRVTMREPDPKEAAAPPAWAPKHPGGHQSRTIPVA